MSDQEQLDSFQARVVGRVQGVGFRWYVQQAATQLGLTGTVRNMRDGRVEVWADFDDNIV